MFFFSPFFRIKILLLPGWAKSTRKTRKSKKAHSPKKGENKEKKSMEERKNSKFQKFMQPNYISILQKIGRHNSKDK